MRDLDFLVENLTDCGYDMTVERMEVVRGGNQWEVYDNYDETMKASKNVRSVLGLPEVKYPPEDFRTYNF